MQMAKVATCDGNSTPGHVCTSGTNIVISPGLRAANWSASFSPGAWWTANNFSSGVGIENLTLDTTADAGDGYYGIVWATGTENGWMKNVRSINRNDVSGAHKHFWQYGANHMTLMDSYFYGGSGTSENYGLDWGDQTGNGLAINNIFQHISTGIQAEGGHGHVGAYNYMIDNWYNNGDPNWQQSAYYHHTEGNHLILWEGNIGDGMSADNIHGSSWMYTAFRNRFIGQDMFGGSTGGKTEQTVPIMTMSLNRFYNIIGNVLGKFSYHTNYESYPTVNNAATGQPNATTGRYNHSIFVLGWSGTGGAGVYNASMYNDLQVRPTMMRWGNWDNVTNAVRWNASEVPSGIAKYANSVPSSQTLPNSFFLASRPTSWWATPWGTPPWPPIGPDVTGGDIANTGGHANKIPAQLCYENTAADTNYSTDQSGLRPIRFDASVCYLAAR
jgi:hypothetical protein